MAVSLKNVNWKRNINTGIKVLMDTKSIGLIILFGFTIYGIGWDTVLRPNLEQMKTRDEAIAEERKVLEAKSNLQKEYGQLEQQLKDLDTVMVSFQTGDQPNLVALTVADELQRTAKGQLRQEEILPSLPAPHNHRENVFLIPTGEAQTVDILKPDGASADGSAAPAPQQAVGGSVGATGDGDAQVAAPSSTLPVERFNYDLKVTGTYPALVDVLNELVLRKKLIRINRIEIMKPVDEQGGAEPDASDVPDYPVKLDMVVSLSVYLYAADPAAAPANP